jgi:hypothetical protein
MMSEKRKVSNMNAKKYIPNIAKRDIIRLINAIRTANSYLAQNKHATAEIFQRPKVNLESPSFLAQETGNDRKYEGNRSGS